MAMGINTNVMSLNAQRNLTSSQSAQNTAMERLTSGKRINSAADDAAGLSIANGLTSQVRGLDQAIRNANDGVSLVQTAEGALQESTNILQRMRELSVQSANGTYTSGNRDSLQAEVQQLSEELTRIAETTSFNSINILDGSLGSFDLQVGAEANQTIGIKFAEQGFAADDLGSGNSADVVGIAMTGDAAGLTLAGATVTINDIAVSSSDIAGHANMNELIAKLEDKVSNIKVGSFVEVSSQSDAAAAAGDGILTGANVVTITVQANDGTTSEFNIQDTSSLEELKDQINDKANGTVKASIDDSGKLSLVAEDADEIILADLGAATGLTAATYSGSLTLSSTDGSAITVDYADASDALDLGITERLNDGGEVTGYTTGTIADGSQLLAGDVTINGVAIADADTTQTNSLLANIDAINAISAETGVYATVSGNQLTLKSTDGGEFSVDFRDNTAAATRTTLGMIETNIGAGAGDSVADVDISTVDGAQRAIKTIDSALETINNSRGEMGAITNRLDYTINNLSNVSQSASASRSRIEDADFAQESAALSRAQVLQQAGTAMLAQANAAPQQVLSLLQ